MTNSEDIPHLFQDGNHVFGIFLTQKLENHVRDQGMG